MCQSKAEGGYRCPDSNRRKALRRSRDRLRALRDKMADPTLSRKDLRGLERKYKTLKYDHDKIKSMTDADYEKMHVEQEIEIGVEKPYVANPYIDQYIEQDRLDLMLQVVHGDRARDDVRLMYMGQNLVRNVERDMARVEALYEAGDLEGLNKVIDERVNADLYLKALEDRNRLVANLKQESKAYEYLKQAYAKEEIEFEPVRQLALALLEQNDSLNALKAQMDEYRSVTALAAQRSAELVDKEAQENGTYKEYTRKTLNNLRALGHFESGTKEWLESRQGGIGGSDVGSIMRVDPDYGSENYKETFWSKVDPIDPDQVERYDLTTAIGRGNAWEERVLQMYEEAHPEANVVRCKTSWQHKAKSKSFQFANFDGLLADENGKIDGILEIKTGSIPEKWGPEEDGLDGVPPEYKAQVLWYAQAAGLKRGTIVALLDDREMRVYNWTLTPELAEEQATNFAHAERFWKDVQKARKDPTPFRAKKRSGGFGPTVLRSPDLKGKDTVISNLAAYRQESLQQVRKRYYELLDEYGGAESTPQDRAEVLRRMFTEHDPATRTKPLIGLDLECSSLTPTRGHIIELGLSVRTPDGKTETAKVSRLYGLSSKARNGVGTGAEDIHGISLADLHKKRRFEDDPKHHEKLLDIMKSGVLVTHNYPYERKFLRVHLPGFAEAEDKGEIQVIDTYPVSRYLFPEQPNFKLESLVENMGGKYENAHRAYNDVVMMMDALVKVQKRLRSSS